VDLSTPFYCSPDDRFRVNAGLDHFIVNEPHPSCPVFNLRPVYLAGLVSRPHLVFNICHTFSSASSACYTHFAAFWFQEPLGLKLPQSTLFSRRLLALDFCQFITRYQNKQDPADLIVVR
jgi:hypothetical protein